MEYHDVHSTSPGANDWAEEEAEINGYVNGEAQDQDGDGENVQVEERVKPERCDPVLSSEVIAILNELGHYNRLTKTYQLNQKNAQSCLRDLIRYLRNDGNSFFVRRQMGVSNVVNNDLLPIIEQHTVDIDTGNISQEGKLIMDKVIRLLVDLTNPTMLHYRDNHIPKSEKDEIPIYLQLQQSLYKYKIAFAIKKRFWIVLAKHLTRILSLDEVDRQLEDTQMFERIIILIRNVLHIPIMEDQSQKGNEDLNIQDRIIEHLHEQSIFDILQYMISSNDFQEYCFHVIEIIFLIYREQSAEYIAKSITGDPLASENLLPEDRASLLSTAGRNDYEIEIDRKEFQEARLRDLHSRGELLNKNYAQLTLLGSGKYSRPSFIVQGMKSISDRDMICHKLYANPETEIDLNKDKKSKTRARNRRLMEENMDCSDAMGVQRFRKSTRKIRLILGEFAAKFLDDCYNSFMRNIRQNLSRSSDQDHDETYYLWAGQFFMEFNRFRPKVTEDQRYECVLETVSGAVFHYIQTNVQNYMEHLGQKQFKAEFGDWTKRLHCALRMYRELLLTLQNIDGFKNIEAKKLSNKVKTDIFTEQEYREFLFRLLKDFDEMKMSKAYLRDLIETNHLFLKMLEYHVKISYNFKVNVVKKVVKRRPKKKKNETGDGDKENEAEPEVPKDPEEIWQQIHEKLLDLLNSDNVGESNLIETSEELRQLFDPLSERSLDEQKLYLMRKIHSLLCDKECEKAIGLYREARLSLLGVDEDNTFGDLDMSVEDELAAMKEILMADFPMESKEDEGFGDGEDEADNNNEEEEDEDDEGKAQRKEIYFNMDDTVRNYARPEILRAYRTMLKNYRHNKPETNRAIVKMIHRIAVDLKMPAMFYNLGYLNCFERILSDPALEDKENMDSAKEYVGAIKDLAKFAFFVTRSFFKLLAKYPKISAELCFTANARDCYSMEFGYDDSRVGTELKALKNKKNQWTEEQELELEVLYKEFHGKIMNGEVDLKGPDGKKRDVVDLIQERFMDESRTRRQIIAQLKKMGLLQGKIKQSKPKSDVVVQYSSGEEDNGNGEDNGNELGLDLLEQMEENLYRSKRDQRIVDSDDEEEERRDDDRQNDKDNEKEDNEDKEDGGPEIGDSAVKGKRKRLFNVNDFVETSKKSQNVERSQKKRVQRIVDSDDEESQDKDEEEEKKDDEKEDKEDGDDFAVQGKQRRLFIDDEDSNDSVQNSNNSQNLERSQQKRVQRIVDSDDEESQDKDEEESQDKDEEESQDKDEEEDEDQNDDKENDEKEDKKDDDDEIDDSAVQNKRKGQFIDDEESNDSVQSSKNSRNSELSQTKRKRIIDDDDEESNDSVENSKNSPNSEPSQPKRKRIIDDDDDE